MFDRDEETIQWWVEAVDEPKSEPLLVMMVAAGTRTTSSFWLLLTRQNMILVAAGALLPHPPGARLRDFGPTSTTL